MYTAADVAMLLAEAPELGNLADRTWRLKNLYKIIDKNSKLIPFQPNCIQKEFYEYMTGRDVQLKDRQSGFSTGVILLYLDEAIFEYDNAKVRIIADKIENLDKLWNVVKIAYENLPPVLKAMCPTIRENRREIRFEHNNSHITVTLDVHSESVTHLLFSEVAFMEGDVGARIRESMQSIPVGRGRVVMESIANGMEYFYNAYNDAKSGKSIWAAHFHPWYKTEDYRLLNGSKEFEFVMAEEPITENENSLISRYGINLEQIAWRRFKINEIRHDPAIAENPEKFFREKFPEDDVTCFITTGQTRFNTEIIVEHYQSRIPKPAHRADIYDHKTIVANSNGSLLLYQKLKRDGQYLIPGDVAEGIRLGDYSVAYVFDRLTWERVAMWRGKVEPSHFGMILGMLGQHYNWAVVAPEANNHGHTSINALRAIYGYPEHLIHSSNVGVKARASDKFKAPEKRFGWITNASSKVAIIDNLAKAIEDRSLADMDQVLYEECLTYIDEGNGKSNALPGKNDDAIMAYAIGLYLLPMYPAVQKRDEADLWRTEWLKLKRAENPRARRYFIKKY